ncbi:large ribosomal subunit protein eL14 [Tribolium castaneum]|uniref:Large ribosomal subunit protein eL14 n=1 Tax=Tribolium castaneum TaxID=7070 RepID=D6WI33_TRICA|nr:PREDICTED: 60S ribosomal protein L14 [Tribolium castaneum]EFA01051.1 60S ribosomal protein L14-like Protein [Tribolium castaneum]|eukprot:XP_969696.1 PREDICTED: 60S ribosomal protein L14 [Tribolium castaneum]
MPFKRFVETGRVALVADGPNKGKLVSIVDVIDQTRVLVDGPASKVPRGQLRLNQLHLTKFRLKFPFTASTRIVRKAWTDAKIDEQWADSAWAKKVAAKKKRAQLTDFDRFKLRRARSRRNHIRTITFRNLKKAASRNGTLYGKKKMAKGGDKPKPKKGAQVKKGKSK